MTRISYNTAFSSPYMAVYDAGGSEMWKPFISKFAPIKGELEVFYRLFLTLSSYQTNSTQSNNHNLLNMNFIC